MFREFAIAKKRRDDDVERDISMAWHSANFHRADKLPSLKSVLAKLAMYRPQSVAEQRGVLQGLSQQLGIPLKRVRLIRKDAA